MLFIFEKEKKNSFVVYRFLAIRELQRVSNCANKKAMHIQGVLKRGVGLGHISFAYDVNLKKKRSERVSRQEKPSEPIQSVCLKIISNR